MFKKLLVLSLLVGSAAHASYNQAERKAELKRWEKEANQRDYKMYKKYAVEALVVCSTVAACFAGLDYLLPGERLKEISKIALIFGGIQCSASLGQIIRIKATDFLADKFTKNTEQQA